MKDRGQFLGSLVLGAALIAGCAAPRQTEPPVLPSPTPETTLFVGPTVPEPTILDETQLILAEIQKRSAPDQTEISHWQNGPEVATFPPAQNPPSEEDKNKRGRFVEARLDEELQAMEGSRVRSVRDSGNFLDTGISNSFDFYIGFEGDPQPMSISYADGQFSADVSADFIMQQSGESLSVSFVRLTSGLSYVMALNDPENLTHDQAIEFVSKSYADEIDTYLELAAKTGYFTIQGDPNFQRILSTYIQYGSDSQQYHDLMENVLKAPNDNLVTS